LSGGKTEKQISVGQRNEQHHVVEKGAWPEVGAVENTIKCIRAEKLLGKINTYAGQNVCAKAGQHTIGLKFTRSDQAQLSRKIGGKTG